MRTTAVKQQQNRWAKTVSSQNKAKGLAIQAKLTIGQPNDKYEQEADRIADRVMRMPDRTTVQRKCTACEEKEKVQQKPLVTASTPWVQKRSDEENHNVLQNKLQSSYMTKLSIFNPLPGSAREPDASCNTSISCVPGVTNISLNYGHQEGNYNKNNENIWNRSIYYRKKEVGNFKPVFGSMRVRGGTIPVTNLNPSTTYEFKVVCSSSGRSASTKEGTTECKTLPGPPKKENKIQKKSLATCITPWVQRQAAGEPEVSTSLESRLNSSKSGGQSLPENTRSFMEQRIGADFSAVKIHTDSNAVQMSQELGAQAFTHGNHIYFNSGKYSPESTLGKHLLAHEMVHTVQQRANKQLLKNQVQNKTIQRQKITPGEPKHWYVEYKIPFNRKVEKFIENADDALKGRFGELMADRLMKRLGYVKIGQHDAPQGIDSIWMRKGENTAKYVIVEAKYRRSGLKWTKDSKQLSAKWTRDRIEEALFKRRIINDMQRSEVVRYLVRWDVSSKLVRVSLKGGVVLGNVAAKTASRILPLLLKGFGMALGAFIELISPDPVHPATIFKRRKVIFNNAYLVRDPLKYKSTLIAKLPKNLDVESGEWHMSTYHPDSPWNWVWVIVPSKSLAGWVMNRFLSTPEE